MKTMYLKSNLANHLASIKMIDISLMPENKKPQHYKQMDYVDWCKYYFKLPKKLILQFLHDKGFFLEYYL